jgi:hypothetical protein
MSKRERFRLVAMFESLGRARRIFLFINPKIGGARVNRYGVFTPYRFVFLRVIVGYQKTKEVICYTMLLSF